METAVTRIKRARETVTGYPQQLGLTGQGAETIGPRSWLLGVVRACCFRLSELRKRPLMPDKKRAPRNEGLQLSSVRERRGEEGTGPSGGRKGGKRQKRK